MFQRALKIIIKNHAQHLVRRPLAQAQLDAFADGERAFRAGKQKAGIELAGWFDRLLQVIAGQAAIHVWKNALDLARVLRHLLVNGVQRIRWLRRCGAGVKILAIAHDGIERFDMARGFAIDQRSLAGGVGGDHAANCRARR